MYVCLFFDLIMFNQNVTTGSSGGNDCWRTCLLPPASLCSSASTYECKAHISKSNQPINKIKYFFLFWCTSQCKRKDLLVCPACFHPMVCEHSTKCLLLFHGWTILEPGLKPPHPPNKSIRIFNEQFVSFCLKLSKIRQFSFLGELVTIRYFVINQHNTSKENTFTLERLIYKLILVGKTLLSQQYKRKREHSAYIIRNRKQMIFKNKKQMCPLPFTAELRVKVHSDCSKA